MRGLSDLDPYALKRVRQELTGETILWAGRPCIFSTFLNQLPLFVIGITCVFFVVLSMRLPLAAIFDTGFGTATVASGTYPYFSLLFALPFFVIALNLSVSPLWSTYKAQHTVHLLTATRLVTITLGPNTTTTRSIMPKNVVQVTRSQYADGKGTLTFSLGLYRGSDGEKEEVKEVWTGVPDAELLEELVRDAMAAGRNGT